MEPLPTQGNKDKFTVGSYAAVEDREPGNRRTINSTACKEKTESRDPQWELKRNAINTCTTIIIIKCENVIWGQAMMRKNHLAYIRKKCMFPRQPYLWQSNSGLMGDKPKTTVCSLLCKWIAKCMTITVRDL